MKTELTKGIGLVALGLITIFVVFAVLDSWALALKAVVVIAGCGIGLGFFLHGVDLLLDYFLP